MEIRPFEELEAQSRARYRARYAVASPEPIVINVDAVLQYTAPRRFEVGGIGLRAPPLSFLAGVRLLTAANALRDVLAAGEQAPPEFLDTTRDTAILLIGQSVRPVRLFRRLRGRWLRVFHAMASDELEQFLRFLLYVPDSSPPPVPSERQVTIDMMDVAKGVTRTWPAEVDPKTGLPRTWAAYIYGSRHLGRVRAREDLRMATVFRIAQGADKTEWQRYTEDERAAAGW